MYASQRLSRGRTNEAWDGYDDTGGQTIGVAAITVNLLERTNSNSSIFTLAADELTIDADGTYAFWFRGSSTSSNGTRSTSRWFLEEDPGGGFVEVPGTRFFTYDRNLGSGDDTGAASCILQVTAGNIYRLRAIRDSGSDNTIIADGSGLSVVKLF